MHGITDKDVAKAPVAGRRRRSKPLKFIGDAIVVGHSVGFDLGFIEEAARRRRSASSRAATSTRW